MQDFIGKRIKITTPTNRVFYGECIYILKEVHVGVLYDNGYETAFNTNDGVKVELESVDLPKASETTASPSKAAAVEGILTEEELKEIERIFNFASVVSRKDMNNLIYSHRAIQERNRNLVLENDELNEQVMKLIQTIKGTKYYLERDAQIPAEQLIDRALEETK